jgi:hypothetical protein
MQRKPNSDGLIKCLPQPGQFCYWPPKSMRVNINPLIKSCGTRTVPVAETKSIGLPADALVSWFLQCHLDSFAVTGQLLPTYRDSAVKTVPSGRENLRPSIWTLQKHMPTPTQTPTPYTTGPSDCLKTYRIC